MAESFKQVSAFDYINDISYDKNYIFDENDSKNYNQFLINRAFGQHMDTVLLANEANKMVTLSKRMHHDFLFYSIDGKKRYGKWAKANEEDSEMIEFVQTLYNVNREVALDYIELLDKKELKQLKLKYDNKGGTQK